MNIKSKLVAAFALVVFVLPGITFASVAQTTPTVAQLQAQIAALLAVVQSLEAQLAALNGSAKACPTWGCNGPSPVVPIVGTTTTTPSVTVLWPNGGEVLNDNGSSNLGTIKWITANFGSLNIEIDLMDSSGNILKAIATGIPNVGSYAWASDPTIPNGSYKIRISSEDKGTSASDSSNGFFQITGSPLGTNANPSLVIEVPNAGSGYVEGQPMTVEWNESGVTPENVRISLMNGAGALTTLASLGASTVSSWTGIVPSNIPAGSNYVIIVCDENVPSPVANAKPLCANSPNISIAPRLGIVANPAFASGDVTAGTIGARIGSYVISAPNVEALQLKNISITDGMSAADFQNFRVLVNGTQFGPTQALSSSNQNFQGSVIIPANGSVIVDVLADVLSSAPAGNQNTTAIYANGVGQTTFASYTSPGSSIVGQTMTVTGGTITVSTPTSSVGGILTASISPNTPASSYVGMGITGVHVVQYQFTANASGNEDLTQLNMTDVAGSRDYGTFINYRLTDASGNVLSTAAETTNGTLVFNLTGLNIPSNSTAYVNLVADVNAYPYATSGAQHAFVLNSFQYSNAAGANTAQPTNGSNNRTFTVYQTTLNAMGASFVNPTSVSTVGNTVGEFTFTVGSGNISPTVKTITLSTTGSLIQSGTAQTLGLYDAAAPSVLLASAAMSGTNSATFNITAANANQWTIPSGSSKTLLVKVISAPANFASMNNGNTGNYQVLLQGVTWTDGVTTNIPSLSPSIMMPIASQNVIGLSSGTTPPVSVPAPTVTISANPITITAGQSTTLTWSSTNATTCTASGATGNVWSGAVATAGSQTVTPVNNPGLLPYSIGYTITCNGTGGTSNPSSVSVQVNAPAVPAPTTSSIAPSQGTVNTSVTLSGANLSGITSIEFVNPSGQVVGSLTNPLSISSTNTSATFVIPSVFEAMVGPGTYQVEVVTSAGTSNGQSFVMVAPSPVYSCTNTSAACQNQSACTSVGSCSVGSCSASNCAVPQQYGGCGGTWIPGCNGAWVAGGTSMNVQTPAMINQTAIISQSLKGLLNQLSALLKSL